MFLRPLGRCDTFLQNLISSRIYFPPITFLTFATSQLKTWNYNLLEIELIISLAYSTYLKTIIFVIFNPNGKLVVILTMTVKV